MGERSLQLTRGSRAWKRAVRGDSLCAGSTGQAFVTQVEQMSDIMADGSVGLGLDAVAVKLGEAKVIQAPPPPALVACDGGT